MSISKELSAKADSCAPALAVLAKTNNKPIVFNMTLYLETAANLTWRSTERLGYLFDLEKQTAAEEIEFFNLLAERQK